MFLSVVLSVRNEQDSILSLINCFREQTYKHFELIVVNDHSTDETNKILTEIVEKCGFQITLLQANLEGKKMAIRQAVSVAKGDFIVSIDADTFYPNKWLEAIAECLEEETPDLIIAPVTMTYTKSFYSRLQAIEFLSLSATTAASANMNASIMCNGANLAFKKSVYLNIKQSSNELRSSGDDMFLMTAIKKFKAKIFYLASTNAKAEIKPHCDIKSLLQQRMRWVSKSSSYRDKDVIISGFIVFFTQFLILTGILLSVLNPYYLPFFVSLLILKYSLDAILLIVSTRFFGQKELIKYSSILFLIYPFYVLGVVVLASIVPIKWKERKVF